MAVGISAELDLEIKKLVSKLGQADARVGRFASEGMRKGDRFAKGFEGSVGRGAQRAGGSVSRFFSGFRGAARAAVGIAGITTTLVILNRRFPAIGQVASKTFQTITSGALGAVGATNNVVKAMGNLRTAATVAVGVAALARAYRALRGSGGGSVQIPKLPSASSGGGAGGIMGQVFGGTLLGGLASRGIGNLMDGARNAIASAVDQVKSSFGKAADMEQMQISFGVLLGSDAAGNDLIKELERRAAKTSFEMPSLTDAAQKLLQFDVAAQDILPTLDMLGDISGGNAQKLDSLALAFGQMASTGRLMGGELLQMINAGFNPLQEISKRTGKDIKTLKKEMEMGDIDAEVVIQAFRDATSEGGRFYGMMAKQSKSAVGLMSTLRDAWNMNMLAFGQPVMESVKPLLMDAIGLVERMRERAVELGKKLAIGIDYARAAFQEFSGGELLAMAGDGLKLVFMEAVNVLGRALQAVFKVANDQEFMSGLQAALEDAALAFREVMLGTMAEIAKSLEEAAGPDTRIGLAMGAAANRMGIMSKIAGADREALAAENKGKPMDAASLGKLFVEAYKNASDVTDTAEVKDNLREYGIIVRRRAAKNKADFEKAFGETEGGGPAGPTTKSGPIKFATGGAGGIQNQVNALFGRPLEAIASAQLSATQKVAKAQAETNRLLAENLKTPPRPIPPVGTGVFAYG